jgi:TetR/AcrR family transcriptional repressor of nem operon
LETVVSESFTAQLEHKLKKAPPKRKGDRTRERLKLGAARVLENVGYHALRIVDITEAAETSDGSFYIYFKDKKDITLCVLQEFLENMQQGELTSQEPRTAFQSIRESNLGWLAIVRSNAGLMRCVLQLADEDPEFGRVAHEINRNWLERIARSVVRNHPDGNVEYTAALFASFALGAMMDELIRHIAVYPKQSLLSFLDEVCPTDEDLADALSVIWFRTLYPDQSLPDDMGSMARQLKAFAG